MISQIPCMAQLLVRNLDPELVRDLKKRAGEHGVSVEEEHRRILREVLRGQPPEKLSFWEMLGEMPDAGDDDLFARDRRLKGRATEENLFGE
jgi:antitoxin FitA